MSKKWYVITSETVTKTGKRNTRYYNPSKQRSYVQPSTECMMPRSKARKLAGRLEFTYGKKYKVCRANFQLGMVL